MPNFASCSSSQLFVISNNVQCFKVQTACKHKVIYKSIKFFLGAQVFQVLLRFELAQPQLCSMVSCWLWSPYGIGQTIIFSSCGFFFFLLSFFPRLISRHRLDVCHTSTHGVALVRS